MRARAMVCGVSRQCAHERVFGAAGGDGHQKDTKKGSTKAKKEHEKARQGKRAGGRNGERKQGSKEGLTLNPITLRGLLDCRLQILQIQAFLRFS